MSLALHQRQFFLELRVLSFWSRDLYLALDLRTLGLDLQLRILDQDPRGEICALSRQSTCCLFLGSDKFKGA